MDGYKIGIVVTNNGNRLLGYLNNVTPNNIIITEPIVIVRGEISNDNPSGEIVLSNIDSLIGLNIVDQIDSLVITNPSFYTYFVKDEEEYEKFHRESYDGLIKSFKQRFDLIKESNNKPKKDCGCKKKAKLKNMYDKLKAKQDNI